MANTRKPKKFSTGDNDGSESWSNLNQDLLYIIMMQVGVFDFIALSGVCKQWRSVAVSNWNTFMVSKQPMRLSISNRLNKKDCYLEDYSRRKLMTTIPHSYGRICVGLTCGYLIFFGRKTNDFWLVNPLTRKELHFPGFLFTVGDRFNYFRGILVFSASMSGWLFVVSHSCSCRVYFSLAGKQAGWRYIYSDSPIRDLHVFKGKIYMINTFSHLFELRLNPELTLTLQKMKIFPRPRYKNQEFLSAGENLYVRDTVGDVFRAVEVDFDEMNWVNSEKTIGEYTIFVNDFFKCNAAIKPDTWVYPWTQYKKLNYSQIKKNDRCSTTNMWYFPHECLIYNNSEMKNGGLLNTLED